MRTEIFTWTAQPGNQHCRPEAREWQVSKGPFTHAFALDYQPPSRSKVYNGIRIQEPQGINR